eukprot:TRINITY_DN214_c0_g1_i2.p1 TRINITY_DN214_c0_g1~~TRINITY_DN214_c0_g1_i2.p1  ORF type:complete len:266 (+),score=33.41 TRINITY_DN214_c0_g1_i2:785-1582(+)
MRVSIVEDPIQIPDTPKRSKSGTDLASEKSKSISKRKSRRHVSKYATLTSAHVSEDALEPENALISPQSASTPKRKKERKSVPHAYESCSTKSSDSKDTSTSDERNLPEISAPTISSPRRREKLKRRSETLTPKEIKSVMMKESDKKLQPEEIPCESKQKSISGLPRSGSPTTRFHRSATLLITRSELEAEFRIASLDLTGARSASAAPHVPVETMSAPTSPTRRTRPSITPISTHTSSRRVFRRESSDIMPQISHRPGPQMSPE